ncbi:hypothetical protein M2324_003874 [Rhodovulum sulfidophilum]|uniref:hypothetical protein n=1 Tax=Rhodovulum sulfidophilum TaxID=35806 RepID=UPI000B1AEF00|nr:hypothetical protein [Rhodovulum sulfidophilum]MCW2305449.1 hypothetical protein [Rhodovulum sulfidophilum]
MFLKDKRESILTNAALSIAYVLVVMQGRNIESAIRSINSPEEEYGLLTNVFLAATQLSSDYTLWFVSGIIFVGMASILTLSIRGLGLWPLGLSIACSFIGLCAIDAIMARSVWIGFGRSGIYNLLGSAFTIFTISASFAFFRAQSRRLSSGVKVLIVCGAIASFELSALQIFFVHRPELIKAHISRSSNLEILAHPEREQIYIDNLEDLQFRAGENFTASASSQPPYRLNIEAFFVPDCLDLESALRSTLQNPIISAQGVDRFSIRSDNYSTWASLDASEVSYTTSGNGVSQYYVGLDADEGPFNISSFFMSGQKFTAKGRDFNLLISATNFAPSGQKYANVGYRVAPVQFSIDIDGDESLLKFTPKPIDYDRELSCRSIDINDEAAGAPSLLLKIRPQSTDPLFFSTHPLSISIEPGMGYMIATPDPQKANKFQKKATWFNSMGSSGGIILEGEREANIGNGNFSAYGDFLLSLNGRSVYVDGIYTSMTYNGFVRRATIWTRMSEALQATLLTLTVSFFAFIARCIYVRRSQFVVGIRTIFY